MTKNLKYSFPVHDVVCSLLEKPFSNWLERDQVDVIKVDRPQVTLFPKERHFEKQRIIGYLYFKYPWICGSTYFQNLHCWPCLLFAQKCDRWDCDLIYDENDCDVLEEHAKKESHINCEMKLAEFEVLKCEKGSDERMDKSLLKDGPQQIPPSEELTDSHEVQLNRQCAQLVVDAILFMVKNQMSLVQEDHSSPCSYSDLFHLLLSQCQDEELKNHFCKMNGSVNPILTKSMLQGVLESVSECILEQLQIAVEVAEFFCLRIDDGLDESSDCSLFIRIVNPNNELKEFFVGSYNLGDDKTSLTLFQILDSVLEKYQYKNKLIGICFDVTCVKFNYLKDLRVGMKLMAQQSTNVNLFGHCLDYTVEKCLNRIPTCRRFFASLNELLNLTKVLVKRNYSPNFEAWSEVCKVRKSCCSKFKLLTAMLEDWVGIFKFFQTVQEETVDFLYLVPLVSEKLIDHQFVFLAVFIYQLFDMTNTLYRELVFNKLDPVFCQERVKEVCVTLYKKRNDACYEATSEEAEQIWRECSGADDPMQPTAPDACYKSLYFEILDNLIMELHTRFENTDQHTYFEIGNLFEYDADDLFIRELLTLAQNFFPNVFEDIEELERELLRLHNNHRFKKIPLLDLIFKLKSKCVKKYTFAHAYKLMTLITLQTPSTQQFSCLHEYSDYLNDSDMDLRPYLENILMNKDFLNVLSSRYFFKYDVLNKLSLKYDAIKLSHMAQQESDVSNLVQQKLIGRSLKSKEGVLPCRFGCQPERKKFRSSKKRRLTIKERKQVMRQILDNCSRKDVQKNSKEIKREYNFDSEVEPHVRMTPGTTIDMIVQMDPTTFTPDIETSDILEPEPDSSIMEQNIRIACKTYPAGNHKPDFPIKIKEEPLDPDIYVPDILSVNVKQEPDDFSGELSVRGSRGSLFQPPVLIKEEPVSLEEES